MRNSIILFAVALVAAPLCAQRHSGSPPTAPRPAPVLPVVAASSGMGAIQFATVNYGVPAPQSLTRQLRTDDERTRASALSAIGAPSQYMQHGHTGLPHSIQLEFAALGPEDELDAILTAEFDHHIVTAILIPDGDNWRRIATILVADPFADVSTTPSTFAHTSRSLLEHDRYRVVFHAETTDGHGNYTQNEAHLRLINRQAVITTSFVSASRDCTVPPPTGKQTTPNPTAGCNVLRRWLQTDPAEPYKQFTLVTATGRLSYKEATSPLGNAEDFDASHLRNFACQPFSFSDVTLHFEPIANSAPCPAK